MAGDAVSRLLYVDAIGGVAGDMLLAALLDTGASEEVVRRSIEAVVPGRFRLGVEAVDRAGLRALRLDVRADGPPLPRGRSAERPSLPPRASRELSAAVEGAPLAPEVARRALAVLERLARAESTVHGVEASELHLYELGDDDTLIDVVGVCAALDHLDVQHVYVSSLPLSGGGTVRTSEGELPLPAPATVELLRGFDIRGSDGGELVTPTGAAILAALGTPARAIPDMALEAVGYGAGTRNPAGRPNVVRVLLGSPVDGDARMRDRTLTVLEANVDDLSPELTSDAIEALMESGALDAWTVPVQMKKGRPAFILGALCEPELEDRVRDAFFEATSTFGVRAHQVRRAELDRRMVEVAVSGGTVRVKVGYLGGRVVSATPEHDDVASLAHRLGRPVRALYEEAAGAAQSLRYEDARPT
jgi:pyridinium-3,5-bisthiocarboxylic acid mononucleotide nickel chelatase